MSADTGQPAQEHDIDAHIVHYKVSGGYMITSDNTRFLQWCGNENLVRGNEDLG